MSGSATGGDKEFLTRGRDCKAAGHFSILRGTWTDGLPGRHKELGLTNAPVYPSIKDFPDRTIQDAPQMGQGGNTPPDGAGIANGMSMRSEK